MMHLIKPFILLSQIFLLLGSVCAQWDEKAIGQEIAQMTFPAEISACRPVFHFPPVNQDTTQICWSFATTSFIETEMHRLGLQPVKLSMVYPVYFTFLEKTKSFIRSRGATRFEPGDLFGTVFEIVNRYGIVPQSVYRGQTGDRPTYNQDSLYAELKRYILNVKTTAAWDENEAVVSVGKILDKHLGPPPETFEFAGSVYTPLSFLHERVKLPWNEYLAVTSFAYAPFDTFCSLKVPDNWRHNQNYFNVELDLFYNSLVSAVRRGFSAAIDGDIGEPGRYGAKDLAFIPDFDIPESAVSQASREYRFDKGLTTDDHLMHIIGYTKMADTDWFLVKDSWRDAWNGEHKGYFFYRSDFVKLKVLAYLIHKDAVPEIMARVPGGASISVINPFE